MLVEFPQCPECEGKGRIAEYDVPYSSSLVVESDCPDCDGLGVLIPDEMVEAVAKAEYESDQCPPGSLPWRVDNDDLDEGTRDEFRKTARAGLAALVRYQQEHAEIQPR